MRSNICLANFTLLSLGGGGGEGRKGGMVQEFKLLAHVRVHCTVVDCRATHYTSTV